jgi:ABC-type transport system involved in Fe-S cluster assembly fused permease/ATPase subunit
MMKGQDAVAQLLDTLAFDFAPACLDVTLVCIFLAASYGWALSLLCLAGAASYVLFTILATERQKDLRKKLSAKEGVVYANAIDALLNYETVKAFTREEHECARYDRALDRYFSQMILQQNIAMMIIVVQAIITTVTVALALLAAIVHSFTVGDVVAIVAYLNQIFSPLDKLGMHSFRVSSYFIPVPFELFFFFVVVVF